MADLAEIERKQREIGELARRMVGIKDVDELQKMGKEIAAKAKDLEKSALALVAASTPNEGRHVGGEVRVVLTKDQRQRIVEQTGVGMDTLVIDEDAAGWMRRMPGTEKRVIELKALQQAGKSIVAEAKDKRVKTLIKTLEDVPDKSPELIEVIEQLKTDPDGIEKFAKEQGKRIKANAKPLPEGM